MKDRNKVSLIYLRDGNFVDGLEKYLGLIPMEHRFDIAVNGLKDAFEYYKLAGCYKRYQVMSTILASLPANKRWEFIETMSSLNPSFTKSFLEDQFNELIDLIPERIFELLSGAHDEGVPLIHFIAYHRTEKLKKVLGLLSNEQCFTLLRLKSKYDMTVLANVIKEPKAARIILECLNNEQKKTLINESHHFKKPFINGAAKVPELLQMTLGVYSPDERLSILFAPNSQSKKLIYKVIKNPKSLKMILDELPDSHKDYFLNYQVFGYTVRELMNPEIPRKDLKYTFEKDIDDLIDSTLDDQKERFFKKVDTKSVLRLLVRRKKNEEGKIDLYHHFANIEADDPILPLFMDVLFPEETIDKETMLARLKIRWDINLAATLQPEERLNEARA